MNRAFLCGVAVSVVGFLIPCGCASKGDAGIYAGLYDDDAKTVMVITVALSGARDPLAIPHLIENLNHSDQWVRCQTHIALNTTTENKVDIPYHWDMPESGRKAGQKAWREWYEKEGKSLMTPPEEPRKG